MADDTTTAEVPEPDKPADVQADDIADLVLEAQVEQVPVPPPVEEVQTAFAIIDFQPELGGATLAMDDNRAFFATLDTSAVTGLRRGTKVAISHDGYTTDEVPKNPAITGKAS